VLPEPAGPDDFLSISKYGVPGTIGGHKNGAMLDISDSWKEASQFVGTEDEGESTRLFDRGYRGRNVVAAQGYPADESQGGTGRFIVTE
jgi:hypothetical protein